MPYNKISFTEMHQELMEHQENLREAADAGAIIDELISTSFGGDNESQMKAVQLLKGLATSDDPASNAFMKKLDTFTSGMKKSESASLKGKKIKDKTDSSKLGKVIVDDGKAFVRIRLSDDSTYDVKRANIKILSESSGALSESIKSELDGLGADSIKRAGKLMTLMFKSGDAGDIKSKAKTALKSFMDKIKHIGTEKSGSGIALEIELN